MVHYKKIKSTKKWYKVIALNRQKICKITIYMRFQIKTIFNIIFWLNNSIFNRGMNTTRKEIRLKQLILLQGQVN